MGDEADRPLDDRSGAAVVDGQVDPAQTGQARGQRDHAANVGQPPGVDRLVVVAHQEDAPPLAGEENGQVEL
jgi:hypothetical protein